MAENQIEIEVELTGTKKVEKQVKEIEGGLEGLGETGSKLAETLGSTNEKLGEGLESISGSVGGVREAFGELGGAIKNLGETGPKGLLALIGPLGMVVGAALTVYETFRLITGAAQEAEQAQEAMNAAASDLQSKLESLAEKGVIPTTKELHNFSLAVIQSQLAKEQVQFAMEKYKKQFQAVTTAQKELIKTEKEYKKAAEIGGAELIENLEKQRTARNKLTKAQEVASKAVDKLRDIQLDANVKIQKAAEQEQELEKRSTDSLKAEIKKFAARQKELALIQARINAKGDELAIADAETTQAIKMTRLEEELEDATHDRTVAILERIKASKLQISAEKLELEKLKERQREIIKKEKETQTKANEARRKGLQQRAIQEERERRRQILLDSKLRMMTIEQEQEGSERLLSIQLERLQTSIKLTKEGSAQRLIAEKQFQIAVQKIAQQDIVEKQKQQKEEQERIQQDYIKQLELRHDFAIKMKELAGPDQTIFGLDIEQVNADSEHRLQLLQMQYEKEIALAEAKNEDLLLIQQRYALERTAIEKETISQQADVLAGYFDQYGKGFAEAAVGAILFGESFQEATAQILLGLAEQAGVRSIMSFAEGFAQLALGDPRAAASFKAGALFAGAAVLAGAAGTGLSEGQAGGVPAESTPTGTPTTAPTPERQQASSESMVFNINFGGAVVYDTKKAAEQALADRLVSIMNTRRRGAPMIGRSR